ncbi:MAG: hypothetical protein EXR65_04805 [Dehalococcoidia bacterium]|nr:hypothetical protein [Dehalococcoidia bacterium]
MAVPRNPWSVDDPHALEALREAAFGELKMVYDASNYVFLASLTHPRYGAGLGIYKPARGERPLHDFPFGTLHRREVAAYEFSRLLGWEIIPPTVEREGPRGEGSLQLFVAHDHAQHYFKLREQQRYAEQLIRFAAFDLLANNADRKGGHLVLDAEERLWGIDNGLCFHQYQKLRTVIWDFAGAPLAERWAADIARVRDCLAAQEESTAEFRALLSETEVQALVRRCAALAAHPQLPEMFAYRCVPWPLI